MISRKKDLCFCIIQPLYTHIKSTNISKLPRFSTGPRVSRMNRRHRNCSKLTRFSQLLDSASKNCRPPKGKNSEKYLAKANLEDHTTKICIKKRLYRKTHNHNPVWISWLKKLYICCVWIINPTIHHYHDVVLENGNHNET